MFEGAQWGSVTPFALEKGDALRSSILPPPAKYRTPEFLKQAEEIVSLSGDLTDRQKAIVEFWCNSSDPDELLANWFHFAEFISERDHHSLDDDVKMYFALSNALLDASIATWDAKRFYDTARPATLVPLLFRDKKVKARGSGFVLTNPEVQKNGPDASVIDGSLWIPYQPATSPTPPSPEFPSEESAFSAATAEILARFSGSDHFGNSAIVQKGSSHIEPGIAPQETVTLKWETLTGAADEAGMSTQYAGIHFASADLAGRRLGRLAAARAWAKAQTYFNGLLDSVAVTESQVNAMDVLSARFEKETCDNLATTSEPRIN